MPVAARVGFSYLCPPVQQRFRRVLTSTVLPRECPQHSIVVVYKKRRLRNISNAKTVAGLKLLLFCSRCAYVVFIATFRFNFPEITTCRHKTFCLLVSKWPQVSSTKVTLHVTMWRDLLLSSALWTFYTKGVPGFHAVPVFDARAQGW